MAPAASATAKNPTLKTARPDVPFLWEGRDDYAAKLLAMMRNEFGGHAVQKEA